MEADDLDGLAAAMQSDVRSKLMRHGVLAGYGLFDSKGGGATLLLHPDDETTGIQHSLIPMTQAIIGGLFDEVETKRHLELIERHLLFPDGARLMDRPLPYHGGVETMFRRAESAAFFGREIGLMYVHAHLRYAEALSVAGQPDGLWEALALVNPISLARHLPNASVRQRNTYFSSSDAAFRDRYQASAEWDRVKAGTIAVDGGWRIYSSGPGLFTNMLIRHAFGERRDLGARVKVGRPPKALERARLVRDDFRPPLV
jgi:cellobiose phosphorylase